MRKARRFGTVAAKAKAKAKDSGKLIAALSKHDPKQEAAPSLEYSTKPLKSEMK